MRTRRRKPPARSLLRIPTSPPDKTLAGRPPWPRQEPCRGNLPNASRAATLEPKSSNAIIHIGTKAREAPPWWYADLCEDQKHTRSDENQKTMILGKILAKETHETSGKILAGDAHETPGKTLVGAPARLLPKTSAGPQPGPHLPWLHRRSHVAASPPTRQAPMWQRAASRPTQQAPVWWLADLHEDPTTTPTQQPASLCGAACLVGLDACRSKAERRRTGQASLPSPIKQWDT